MIRNIVLYLCGDEKWERESFSKIKNHSLSGKYTHKIGNVGSFSFYIIVTSLGKFLDLLHTLKCAEIKLLETFIV